MADSEEPELESKDDSDEEVEMILDPDGLDRQSLWLLDLR